MKLSRAGAVGSFVGGLVIGVGMASLFAEPAKVEVSHCRRAVEVQVPNMNPAPIRAEDMRGTWTGTWGYGREFCTIEIERVSGDSFSGTLRKEGAVISIEGRVDARERKVFFKETKVRRLGAHMSEWSLGTNTGTFSLDGRTLTGSGTDKWGAYGWDATKE